MFSFFKHISVFRDKVLKKGVEVGSLTEHQADDLYHNLPTYKPIPAYICGFVRKNEGYSELSYEGKKGRKRYTITSWKGPRKKGDLDQIKATNNVSGDVKFAGIGKFSHESGYLFNTGSLRWTEEDWASVVDNI